MEQGAVETIRRNHDRALVPDAAAPFPACAEALAPRADTGGGVGAAVVGVQRVGTGRPSAERHPLQPRRGGHHARHRRVAARRVVRTGPRQLLRADPDRRQAVHDRRRGRWRPGAVLRRRHGRGAVGHAGAGARDGRVVGPGRVGGRRPVGEPRRWRRVRLRLAAQPARPNDGERPRLRGHRAGRHGPGRRRGHDGCLRHEALVQPDRQPGAAGRAGPQWRDGELDVLLPGR